MKTIAIYYDKFNDVLTFTRIKGLAADPVAKVNIPDKTERDGDCIILPDSPNACFVRRRVTATELFVRAINGYGDISVARYTIGSHTFTFYGKHKKGICLHGLKFPCERCKEARQSNEKYGTILNDEQFRERFTRQKQTPVTTSH